MANVSGVGKGTNGIKGIRGLLLCSLAIGLVSCEAFKSLTSESDSSPTATPSPQASAPASGSSSPNPTASPAPSVPTQVTAGQNIGCDTPNYLGEVTWQGETARMTFGKKPNETNVREATPVAILSNADGSTTYGYPGGEITVYLRAYPNGSCLLQTLSPQGQVTVEETGRTRVSPVSFNGAGGQPIAQSPSPVVPIPGIPLSNPANAAEQPIAQSQPTGPALSCSGTIKDRVDFTAYFAPDAGFNRVIFRPRESKVAVVSALAYSGKNEQGLDTWNGKANEVAKVTLVSSSIATPQPGTQISVDYDGLAGQAVCQ